LIWHKYTGRSQTEF